MIVRKVKLDAGFADKRFREGCKAELICITHGEHPGAILVDDEACRAIIELLEQWQDQNEES